MERTTGSPGDGAGPAGDDAVTVRHAPEARRFEAAVDDGGVAVLTYERVGERTLDLQHTVVPGHARGSGVADALVRAAMAHARVEGLTVVPTCAYVEAWVQRHPEVADLVAR